MDPGPGFAWSADPMHAAATEDDTWRHRVLCGEVHDDNCSALQGSGHAGLFGTADAILNFAQDHFSGEKHVPEGHVLDSRNDEPEAHARLGTRL